jgi:hypothetical protein
VDILRAAAARAGVEVKFVPVPFDQRQLTLEEAYFPLSITPERILLIVHGGKALCGRQVFSRCFHRPGSAFCATEGASQVRRSELPRRFGEYALGPAWRRAYDCPLRGATRELAHCIRGNTPHSIAPECCRRGAAGRVRSARSRHYNRRMPGAGDNRWNFPVAICFLRWRIEKISGGPHARSHLSSWFNRHHPGDSFIPRPSLNCSSWLGAAL